MGNKTIPIILSILIVITLSCGIVGFLNKDKKTTPSVTPSVVENTNSVDYVDSVKNVENLSQILGNYEFIKANKESVNGNIRAFIDVDKIAVEVTDDSNEVINFEISNVPSPVAVSAHMLDTGDLRVYALSENGKIYMSKFNGLQKTPIDTYCYNIVDVESFASTIGSLTTTTSQIYVIIKDSKGEYYTDYQETNGDIILSKLVEQTTSENIQENIQENTQETVQDVGNSQGVDENEEVKNIAINYVKNKNLLDTNSEIDIYIYKLIEEGLLKADKIATDNICLSSLHNTSYGCVTKDNKSINDDYIKVIKVGTDFKAEYIKAE